MKKDNPNPPKSSVSGGNVMESDIVRSDNVR